MVHGPGGVLDLLTRLEPSQGFTGIKAAGEQRLVGAAAPRRVMNRRSRNTCRRRSAEDAGSPPETGRGPGLRESSILTPYS